MELSVGIVASRFNQPVVDELLGACLSQLEKEGISKNNIDLKSVPGALEIPVVLDLMALKIRSIAVQHEVPLYEEPPLARAIHGSTEIGDEIPAPLFLAVAKVLAYVFQVARSEPNVWVPRPAPSPLPDEFAQYYDGGR